MIDIERIYVIHVKSAIERKNHINDQLTKHRLNAEFMLDADVADITTSQLDKYFSGNMKAATPTTSCALKHLLVYEEMVLKNIKKCLILEDDIILHKDFTHLFNESIVELKERHLSNVIISYENSSLQFIPNSAKIKGQKLYQRDRGRCTGAYYIDLEAATSILNFVLREKCDKPIDWLHNEMIDKQLISMYWMDPHIAEQGSHGGKFASMLDHKSSSLKRRISWKLQEYWKLRIVSRFK